MGTWRQQNCQLVEHLFELFQLLDFLFECVDLRLRWRLKSLQLLDFPQVQPDKSCSIDFLVSYRIENYYPCHIVGHATLTSTKAALNSLNDSARSDDVIDPYLLTIGLTRGTSSIRP